MEQTFALLDDTPAAHAGPVDGQPAAARSRRDIYAFIHKALRAAMTDALLAVGRLDAADAREVTATVVRVDALLEFCGFHLDKENAYVHPALEARAPGATRRIADEHRDHEAAIAGLRRKLDALARSPSARRAGAAHELYLALSVFVGENLLHMHEEETSHNATLWDCYSDSEIAAIEGRLKSQLTPAEMQHAMRWMLPALTPAERAAMLEEVREFAPVPVYEGLLAAARAHLDATAMRKLEASLAR